MKKGNFSRFVQEGRLIEFQFEPEPMRAALNEILQLLSSIDSRLIQLESKAPSFAMQKQVDVLQNENKNVLEQLDQTNKNTDTKLEDSEQKITEQLDQAKRYVDDSVSAVLVDVRRLMKTQIDDVINYTANNSTDNSRTIHIDQRPNNSIDEAFKVCSDMQSSIDLILKDINNIRLSVEERVTPEMLKKELEPFIKNTERIGDCDADILTLQLSLQNLQDRVANIESVQKIPGTKVEVVVQKPIQAPSPPPLPEIQNPLLDHEHQMQHKQAETKMKHMQQQLQKIQSNIVQPPTDDSQSIERQVRRLNEFANSFRLALDNHDQVLKGFEEKIEKFISQTNMKLLQDLQNVDQLTSELERVKEQMSELGLSNFTKNFEDVNTKLNNFQKDINAINDKIDKRNQVVRTDARYAERNLPPLQTQMFNVDIDNEEFGLDDSSNEIKVNSGPNSTFNSSRKKGLDLVDDFPSPPHTACSNDRKKMSSRKSKNIIKIIRQPVSRQSSANTNITPVFNVPTLTDEEIKEKVEHAIRISITDFLDRAKTETQKEVQNGLKIVDQVSTKIDQKIDRDFVERMFNKFRIIISDLKDKIDQIQSTFLGWVTREELQQVLEKFVDQLHEAKDTAGGSSKYKCLLCGRPRTHVSGMIVGDAISNAYGDEDDEAMSNYGDDRALKIKKKAATRVPSPTTPKNPKRCKTPVPRDVIQFLTSAETRK